MLKWGHDYAGAMFSMIHQVQNLNEIPRVVFHNLNHLINKSNVSPIDFFAKAKELLNSYLPRHLNIEFTYLLDSSMHKNG